MEGVLSRLAPTINMERRQDDTVDRCNGGHKQCSGLTDSASPFLFSGYHADNDKDVVSNVSY